MLDLDLTPDFRSMLLLGSTPCVRIPFSQYGGVCVCVLPWSVEIARAVRRNRDCEDYKPCPEIFRWVQELPAVRETVNFDLFAD